MITSPPLGQYTRLSLSPSRLKSIRLNARCIAVRLKWFPQVRCKATEIRYKYIFPILSITLSILTITNISLSPSSIQSFELPQGFSTLSMSSGFDNLPPTVDNVDATHDARIDDNAPNSGNASSPGNAQTLSSFESVFMSFMHQQQQTNNLMMQLLQNLPLNLRLKSQRSLLLRPQHL